MNLPLHALRWRFGLLLSATLASAPLRAQQLADPTRPPPLAAAPVAAGSAAGVDAPPAGPQLQAVLLAKGPGARRVAVIDGQTVRVGEKVNGAQLIEVGERSVVLLSGKERSVLKLYPADDSKAAAPTARTQ